MQRFIISLTMLVASTLSFAAEEPSASSYTVGDTLPALELTDQHDQPHTLDANTRLVLFTTGMKGGGVIRDVLDEEEDDFLSSHNAMFISNISGMPKLIAGMIALPRMRGHGYPIVLDREGDMTQRIPSQENSATIIWLNDLKIESIQYTKSSAAVKAAVVAGADQR